MSRRRAEPAAGLGGVYLSSSSRIVGPEERLEEEEQDAEAKMWRCGEIRWSRG